MFDGLFGADHRSSRCILRSSIGSLLAVLVIWIAIGQTGVLETRAQAVLAFPTLLVTGLLVNTVTDYVSLLETRLLLRNMETRWTNPLAQVLILLIDLVLSGAIIFGVLWLYSKTPLHVGQEFGLAELLTAFSVYSVFFYSTFMTSVWVWVFVLGSLVIRAAARLKLARWTDLRGHPAEVLGTVAGLVTLIGALGFGGLNRDTEGITAADRAVCTFFAGEICSAMAELTDDEQVQLFLIGRACEGGVVTEECHRVASRVIDDNPGLAVRILDASCAGGDSFSCLDLGRALERSATTRWEFDEVADKYLLGCEGLVPRSCVELGDLLASGLAELGVPETAVGLYQTACSLKDGEGCLRTGMSFSSGQAGSVEPKRAHSAFSLSCVFGSAEGCLALGNSYLHGFAGLRNLDYASTLWRMSCRLGNPDACL